MSKKYLPQEKNTIIERHTKFAEPPSKIIADVWHFKKYVLSMAERISARFRISKGSRYSYSQSFESKG